MTTSNPALTTRSNSARERWGFPADVLVPLDRSRPRGLRGQLESGLREAIQLGRLPVGSRLPPSRTLGRELAVARSVVVEAYDQLIAEGYLEARQGAGTRVRGTGTPVDAGVSPRREDGVSARLLGGLPDPAHFPRKEWQRQYRAVLGSEPNASFGYPEPQGSRALRQALAAHLGRVRAVSTTPDQILICGGFAQGLALVCRVLHDRGVTHVAIEDPCFSFHRRVIRAAGLEPVPIPVDEGGIEVGRLSERSPDAVLLAPAHSYPTGAVLSPERRRQLLHWARARDALVIEDDYDAEFRYDRAPVGALQGLAPEHVVYGGSASKTLSPALRLGWLAAPSWLTGDLVRTKFLDGIATEALGQLALARFLETGGLSRHLRRVRPVYRARRDALVDALRTFVPQATVTGVAAGLHLYIRLPQHCCEEDLVEAALARGVQIEGAARHWADRGNAPPALIIGYGTLHEASIGPAISSLGDAYALAAGAGTSVKRAQ